MDRLSGLIASPVEELLSFITAVQGVKFYEGLSDLAANKNLLVELIREKDNKYDSNAVLVKTRSDCPKMLGHLEKRSVDAVVQIQQLTAINMEKRSRHELWL